MTRHFASTALMMLIALGSAQATEIGATFETPCPFGDCAAAISLTFLGEVSLPTGEMNNGVEFGGISGLDFDKASGRYVAISDDRSEKAPARFYELEIDIDGKALKSVKITSTTTLKNNDGQNFGAKLVDPEAIRVAPDGLYWSSEGDAKAGLPPFVRVSARDGAFLREFTLPQGFAPVQDSATGIRNNNAFESLTVLPSGDVLVGLEAALYQDGPISGLTTGSLARVIRYDAKTGVQKSQFVYPIEPIPQAAAKTDGWNDNGMPEMLALDEHRALVVERAFAQDFGNNVKLFMIDFADATDVAAIAALSGTKERVVPARKNQILDLRAIGLIPDNIEAMTFATATDGSEVLVLASDNNFNGSQKSQFMAFKINRRPK